MNECLNPDRECTLEEYEHARRILVADDVLRSVKAIFDKNPCRPNGLDAEKRNAFKEAA